MSRLLDLRLLRSSTLGNRRGREIALAFLLPSSRTPTPRPDGRPPAGDETSRHDRIGAPSHSPFTGQPQPLGRRETNASFRDPTTASLPDAHVTSPCYWFHSTGLVRAPSTCTIVVTHLAQLYSIY
jgi:hypothetical protein